MKESRSIWRKASSRREEEKASDKEIIAFVEVSPYA